MSKRAPSESGKVIAPDRVHRPREAAAPSLGPGRGTNQSSAHRLGFGSLFWHITPCACGVRGASAACDGFGFARKTAAPFDVFYWLQVTNFDVLFDSAPKGADHFDVWDFGIHAKIASRLDRL